MRDLIVASLVILLGASFVQCFSPGILCGWGGGRAWVSSERCTSQMNAPGARSVAKKWGGARAIGGDMMRSAQDSAERLVRFDRWLREREILRDSVEVGDCGALGLGLRAKKDISGNQEVLLEVAPSHFISMDTAVSALGELGVYTRAVLQDALAWSSGGGDVAVELGDALIALRLMKERSYGDMSELKPYLDMLPESLGMPLFWPEDERARLLNGCMILSDTARLSQSINNQWAIISDMVIETFPESFPEEYFSLEQFRFHVALSISRAYSSEGIKGLESAGLLLLPGIDMANHNDEVRFAVQGGDAVFSDAGTVAIVSDRPYAEGEQIFTTYGRKSNSQMLYGFGFTREDPFHPHNSADISLEIDRSDPFFATKSEILASSGMYPRMRFQVPVCKELASNGLRQKAPKMASKSTTEMLASLVDSWAGCLPFARLASLGAEETEALKGMDPVEAWLRMWHPLGDEGEAAVVQELVSCFDTLIGMLEAGVVQSGSGDERVRAACIVRASEAAALKEGRRALLDMCGQL